MNIAIKAPRKCNFDFKDPTLNPTGKIIEVSPFEEKLVRFFRLLGKADKKDFITAFNQAVKTRQSYQNHLAICRQHDIELAERRKREAEQHIPGCDTCALCGRDVPEGRQVCYQCEHGGTV